MFEISSRVNDTVKFYKTLLWLSKVQKIMVGYNNLGFDYPVLQHFISLYSQNLDGEALAFELYKYANEIIKNRSAHTYSSNNKKSIHISQLDLMKLHHFDNKAKMVSLKTLEFNMRSQNIEDLPFKPGTTIDQNQIDTLLKYNLHDVLETVKFFHHSQDAINFREELSIKYKENMMNYSDMKIGKQFFIRNLEDRLGNDICFKDGKPRQTIRNFVDFSKIIFDCVEFKTQEFLALKKYLMKQYTNNMKDVFRGLEVRYKDFVFYLGTGGLHGSVESCYYEEDETQVIYDVDVASYYPSIVVQNKLYPEHLGIEFTDIYNEIRELRFSYSKGTPENKMLKLALNAAGFGDTNNQYSPFYDSLMTITITTNGQLMLCMLAESLMVDIESLHLIQANTDGLTVRFHKNSEDKFFSLLKSWEDKTKMELEKIKYTNIWIRDVNNYIAKTIDGKVKKIGAYKDKLEWYQNHSALVVPKAVEAYLINKTPLEEFIKNHKEPFDFMISFKSQRDSKLVLESIDGLKKEYESLQNTIRYYISKDGKALKKVMPPIKNSKNSKDSNENRIIGINVGYTIDICNDASHFSFDKLNYEWYIKEAQKLIDPLFQTKQQNLFDFI
ncbi:MAG: hypothetical protein U9R39_06965 [Campylobacterota bacterium]|nr:hypothetical protein [Campylobacterota bacterium]